MTHTPLYYYYISYYNLPGAKPTGIHIYNLLSNSVYFFLSSLFFCFTDAVQASVKWNYTIEVHY